MTQQTRLSREEASGKVLAVLSAFPSQYGEDMDTDTAAAFRDALMRGQDYEWEFRGNKRINAIMYSASVTDAWFMNFTVDTVNGDLELSHDLNALIDDAVGDYFLNENDRKSRTVIRTFEAWLRKAFDSVRITQTDRNNALQAIRLGKRSTIMATRADTLYTVTFHRPNAEGYIVTLTFPDSVRKGSLLDSRLSDEGTQRIIQALGRIDLFPTRPI